MNRNKLIWNNAITFVLEILEKDKKNSCQQTCLYVIDGKS